MILHSLHFHQASCNSEYCISTLKGDRLDLFPSPPVVFQHEDCVQHGQAGVLRTPVITRYLNREDMKICSSKNVYRLFSPQWTHLIFLLIHMMAMKEVCQLQLVSVKWWL